MKNKKIVLFVVVIAVAASAVLVGVAARRGGSSAQETETIAPTIGTIKTFLSCTGTVLPKNRLEVKPPVGGRVESVLVKEGDRVAKGQTLAWMSSTERAALLDSATGKSEETVQYLQEAYKPIPLNAPIDGDVIVGTTQPGQAVTTADAIVVLSDRLIVRAQVDEVDIGKIRTDQAAIITLDAYPQTQIHAKTDHIYYESKTVNNVTIYEVDLIPEDVPSFFRSGMNATVDFVEQVRENVLTVPAQAVFRENGKDYVLVKPANGTPSVKTPVTIGIADDKNIEVLSGVTGQDKIVVTSLKYSLPTDKTGKNPFMPQRRR